MIIYTGQEIILGVLRGFFIFLQVDINQVYLKCNKSYIVKT